MKAIIFLCSVLVLISCGTNQMEIGDDEPISTTNQKVATQISQRTFTYEILDNLAEFRRAIFIPISKKESAIVNGLENPNFVEICHNVHAFNDFSRPADSAIQVCIDRMQDGDVLELPAGDYQIRRRIKVYDKRNITIRTANLSAYEMPCLWPEFMGIPATPKCATLKVHRSVKLGDMILEVSGGENVAIEHIVMDGNRDERVNEYPNIRCGMGLSSPNVNFIYVARGSFKFNASINTMCGTSLTWLSPASHIYRNMFFNNGDGRINMMWADGLTVFNSMNSTIEQNIFIDNTDVDMVIGGTIYANIRDNIVLHFNRHSFASIMVHYWQDEWPFFFKHSNVNNNIVYCGDGTSFGCDFGIQGGSHPWIRDDFPTMESLDSSINNNIIIGAKLGLNIDGLGSSPYPIAIFNNDISGSPSYPVDFKSCLNHPTSNYNIDTADSFVDHSGDQTPYTTYDFHECYTR